MLIGVGASTWASGSQVWNGNTGTLMAKPMNRNRNIVYWKPGVKNACVPRRSFQALAGGRDASSDGLTLASAARLLPRPSPPAAS